jgi:sugar-specific transcriptional regulator TrmB/DNA-binding CsgD family transcriptional regulator
VAKDRTVPTQAGARDTPTVDTGALAPLGIGPVEETVYRTLLRSPGSTASKLAETLALSPVRLRRAVAELERLGLVSRTPGAVTKFLPAAPDVGIAALVLDREAQLGRVRTVAQQWMEDYHAGRRAARSELVEIITGSDAVLHRFDQLQRSATEEIQVLDTPPYAGKAGPRTNHLEFELLQRGVVCKAIYDREALRRSPRAIEAILRYVAAGEQARVTTRLPMKLATFDRKVAFVPHSLDQPDVSGAIVVHRCSLLDVLLYVFDRLWEQATPLTADLADVPDGEPSDGEPGPDARRLLPLLAAGMTDEAISRHLGWSYRTTRRRIAALMQQLGAETRFQAGLHAARRGWL